MPIQFSLICLLVIHPIRANADSDKEKFFREHVAPVLEQQCLGCHNDKNKRGSLDLTTRNGLVRGGDSGPGVVPGQPDKSLLLEMISGPKPKMPQKSAALPAERVADFRAWIEAGATWPEDLKLNAKTTSPNNGAGWAWSALQRPAVPALRDTWIRSPIDAFVLATLKEHALRPAPEADRITLIRRLSFDLLGLPPTPPEIDAFVGDRAVDAYEQLVERLLASPRYGERWGRHWLDLVHYGDTHGYDKDQRRDNAWPYRDYVINSFNSDKRYDLFVKEQLAGDILYPNDPEAIVATGFVTAGPWDFVGNVELREGTVDKEKTRTLDRDDMVANTISTFVSLTAHCVRCHDHKFDPISQKEYYRLQAVFAGVERGDRALTPQDSTRKVYAVISRSPAPDSFVKSWRGGTAGRHNGPGSARNCFDFSW